jgi:DNA-directed RNA polymerase specialized sigma24 family protein
LPSYSDHELFFKIAEGDEVAFRQLFDRYVPRIKPAIRSFTGTETMVKDLIQNVFLLIWIGREKLPEVRSPENWIFRIVIHECSKWLRHEDVRSRSFTKLTDSTPPDSILSNSTEEYSRFILMSRDIQGNGSRTR